MAGIVLAGCSKSNGGPPFNPTPSISNLFPSDIVVGSPGFTLSVFGTGFVASAEKGASFVYWNGFSRSTSLNQTTGEIQAQIFASDIAMAGPVNVTVVNPAPGGGTSTAVTFTVEPVQAGAPSLAPMSPLSPDSATAGGQTFTLTVNGSNFVANDVVTWNGSFRTTTFVNSSQVTASILTTDIANAGSGSVAVASSPQPTLASVSVNLPITGANNAAPSANSLKPSSATHGSGDLEVLVSGSGFTPLSGANWTNGATTPLALAHLSSSQVIVLIPAEDLTAAGSATIDITNPAPGGGTSKEVPFTIN